MANKSLILLVLDGLGAGDTPDCANFGDNGNNTLEHATDNCTLAIPNLKKIGLYNTICANKSPGNASYGKMQPVSHGKSTMEGHWEMMGIPTTAPYPVYPNGFTDEIMGKLQEQTGRKYLWNRQASGTQIINQLGDEHVKTGMPIIYTSGDSVMQISAHEDVISVPELYEICKVARNIMIGANSVTRVIARPFLGANGSYYRTSRRRDFCLQIPTPNALSKLRDADIPISGVGRIADLFKEYLGCYDYTTSIGDCIEKTRLFKKQSRGFVFVNCEEFDMLYGHRRDKDGFAQGLTVLDKSWPTLIRSLGNNDLLMVTSDHGNDPACTTHTDHTREYSILLAYMKGRRSVDLGIRGSLADIGSTVLDFFGLKPEFGKSFLSEISNTDD